MGLDRSRGRLCAVALALGALLVGCGGGDDEPAPSSKATTAARTTTAAAKPKRAGTADRGARRCTKAAILAALLADVDPLPFKVDRVRCDGEFARARFEIASCPAGQASAACTGPKVAAWRLGAKRWRLIAYDDALSCAAVRQKAKEYPSSLCD